MGETSVSLNQKLVAFRSYSDYVEVDFVNSSTGDLITERAKVLVGADGINSTVRKILYPNEGRPLWKGTTIYRGVTQTDKLYLDGRTMILMGNPNDVELVIYPVDKNLINWACCIRVGDPDMQASPVTSDWNNVGRIEDFLHLTSHMKLDFLDIHHLIESSMIVNQFPMADRDTLPRWTHDRVTLLGDAAHPMYPNGGNGASQTILDVRGLILSFRQHGVTPQGLQAYDDLRRPAANTVVLSARQYGPEEILKIVDERFPSGFNKLSDVISTTELEAMMFNFKQLTGLNVQKLNEEPPLF
jgi:2-polyprenyl-6-methoxyphenol hydroxylase-like FAD-dependent oxidoreductase